MDLVDKVVLITGPSSGIGAATAHAAECGDRVVLAARRTERVQALARLLPEALAVTCDVTDPAKVRAAVAAAVDRHGRLDVLVNNVGQGLHLPLDQVDPADFRAVLELNTIAPLVAMQAVLPVMRAQKSGTIVNVSSATTHRALPEIGVYSASKAALDMLSAVARRELAQDGITVSAVRPSVTATEFHQHLRAGRIFPCAANRPADSADHVAAVILGLIRTGEAEATLGPGGLGPGSALGRSAVGDDRDGRQRVVQHRVRGRPEPGSSTGACTATEDDESRVLRLLDQQRRRVPDAHQADDSGARPGPHRCERPGEALLLAVNELCPPLLAAPVRGRPPRRRPRGDRDGAQGGTAVLRGAEGEVQHGGRVGVPGVDADDDGRRLLGLDARAQVARGQALRPHHHDRT
jgi:NAD(P)-dependent dehydrogenase (short-subunit alcohol dehydrogenase family)